MARVRERPNLIEAVQFAGLDLGGNPIFSERPQWLERALGSVPGRVQPERGTISQFGDQLFVGVADGTAIASPDDWILCGAGGRLAVVKAGDFERRFEIIP